MADTNENPIEALVKSLTDVKNAEDEKKQEEKKQEEQKQAAQRAEREKRLIQSIRDTVVLMVTGVCPLEDLTIESITCVTIGDQIVKVAFTRELGPKAEEAARRAKEPKPEPKKPPVVVKRERYDPGYHGQYPMNNGPQRWMGPRHPGQPPRGHFPRQRTPQGPRMPQDPRMINPQIQAQGQMRLVPHPNQSYGQQPARMPSTRGRGRGRRPSQSPRQPTPPVQGSPVQINAQTAPSPIVPTPVNGGPVFNPALTSTPKVTVGQSFQVTPSQTAGNLPTDSQMTTGAQLHDQPPVLTQADLSTPLSFESMQPPQLTAQDVLAETSQGLESMQISAEQPHSIQAPMQGATQEPLQTLAEAADEQSRSAVRLIAQGIAQEASEVLAQGSPHTTAQNSLQMGAHDDEQFIGGEARHNNDVNDAVNLLMSFDGTPTPSVECIVTTTSVPTTADQCSPVSYQQISTNLYHPDTDRVGASPRSTSGLMMSSADPNMGVDAQVPEQIQAAPAKKGRGRPKITPKTPKEDAPRPGRKRGKQGGSNQKKRQREGDSEEEDGEWAAKSPEPETSKIRRSSRARTVRNIDYQLLISEGTDEEDEPWQETAEPPQEITEPEPAAESEEDMQDYEEEFC